MLKRGSGRIFVIGPLYQPRQRSPRLASFRMHGRTQLP